MLFYLLQPHAWKQNAVKFTQIFRAEHFKILRDKWGHCCFTTNTNVPQDSGSRRFLFKPFAGLLVEAEMLKGLKTHHLLKIRISLNLPFATLQKRPALCTFLQYAISIFPYILDLIIRVPYNANACFLGVIYCGSSEQKVEWFFF